MRSANGGTAHDKCRATPLSRAWNCTSKWMNQVIDVLSGRCRRYPASACNAASWRILHLDHRLGATSEPTFAAFLRCRSSITYQMPKTNAVVIPLQQVSDADADLASPAAATPPTAASQS